MRSGTVFQLELFSQLILDTVDEFDLFEPLTWETSLDCFSTFDVWCFLTNGIVRTNDFKDSANKIVLTNDSKTFHQLELSELRMFGVF